MVTKGTKYIIRSEVLYRRVRSVLDRSPAYLAASDDLKRIAAAYKASAAAADKGTSYSGGSFSLCSKSHWWGSDMRVAYRREGEVLVRVPGCD